MFKKNINRVEKIEGENIFIFQYIDNEGNYSQETKTFEDFFDPFIKPYKEKIDLLEKSIKDKEKIESLITIEKVRLEEELKSLASEKDFLVKQLTDSLERVNRVNFKEVSELHRKAFNYFIEGKIDEVLEILNEDNLIDEEKVFTSKSLVHSELRLLKARVYRIKQNIRESIYNYEKAYSFSPSSILALEIAELCSFINGNIDKAKLYYSKATQTNIVPEKIVALFNYGNFLSTNNDFIGADKLFSEALKIAPDYNKIVFLELNKEFIEGRLLNAYAVLKSKLGKSEEARNLFIKAIEFYEKSEISEDSKVRYSSNAYYNFAIELSRDNQNLDSLKEAIEYAKKSLYSRGKLYKKNPTEFASVLTDTYNLIGNIFFQMGELKDAEISFDKSVLLNRRIAHSNVENLLSLEMSLANQANLFHKLGRREDAEENYLEAESIIRILVDLNKKMFTPKLSDLLLSLASFYSVTDKDKSINYLDELISYLYPVKDNSIGIDICLKQAFQILDFIGIKKDDYLKEKGFIPK